MKKTLLIMLGLSLLVIIACEPAQTNSRLLPPTPPPAPVSASGDLAGQAFATQEDYAPPIDVNVEEYEMQIFFLEPERTTDGMLEYSIRVNHPGGNVFKYAYYFTDRWNEFEFPQETVTEGGAATDWIAGRAQENIEISRAQFPEGIKWALAFSCKERGQRWLCGCKEKSQCGFWMLQSLDERAAPGAPCKTNADCRLDDKCIDSMCGKLSEIYGAQNCLPTCNFNEATLTTNNGDTQIATPGGGDYTSAGALTWTVERPPDHCMGQEAKVPIRLTKKNYGERISESYITLSKGQNSPIITHPAIPTFKFTLKVDEISVTCS